MKKREFRRDKRSVRIRDEKEARKSPRATGPLPSQPVRPYVSVPNERNARIAFRKGEL